MKITIRQLHLGTGRWVRHAATRGLVIVTDREHRVAALLPFDPAMTGRPLPNRETRVLRRARIPIDSPVYQAEVRARL